MNELFVETRTEWATINPFNDYPIVWDSEEKARRAGNLTGHKVVFRIVSVTDWKEE